MQIVDFTAAHIEQAEQIAKQNYMEERGFVPALPAIKKTLDLTPFAENGLGVAAFEGDTMVGFLNSVQPFQKAFGSTEAVGVFSPMGANGAVGNHRGKVYARLYQAAGEKWASVGAASHAVCLYAHGREVQEQFFRYGFGLRGVDAVRGMDEVMPPPCEGYSFSELMPEEHNKVYPLLKLFNQHFLYSPTFMVKPDLTEIEFIESVGKDRFFAAWEKDSIISFINISRAGETFICGLPGYIHVDGAFCLPQHRGKGILQGLLNLAAATLKAEGYSTFGVDFESINPSAYNFWLKYFAAYTYGVVRRIDEKAVLF